MKKLMIWMLFSVNALIAYSQKKVAFTIDDVPNAALYEREGYQTRLLHKIDSMQLPVTIFINESLIFRADSVGESLSLFERWIKDPNVTVGNHGFYHSMYSNISLDSFKTEVIKGETISKQLTKKYGKTEKYYRMPYNDLGSTAKQHKEAFDFLHSRGYFMTPFTMHSDDWLITELYAYYKNNNKPIDAKRVGDYYISKTIEFFNYTEALTDKPLHRPVNHIYLMHDNLLNADYLGELVEALKKKGYTFITLEDALKDPIYLQKDYYEDRHGISWVYRWMRDEKERIRLMQLSPNTADIEKELKTVKP